MLLLEALKMQHSSQHTDTFYTSASAKLQEADLQRKSLNGITKKHVLLYSSSYEMRPIDLHKNLFTN